MDDKLWWLFTTSFGIVLLLIGVLYKMAMNKFDTTVVSLKADHAEFKKCLDDKADETSLTALSGRLDDFAQDVKESLATKIDAVECRMARAWEQDVSKRIEASIIVLKEDNEKQHKDIMLAINKRNGEH